MPIRRIDIRHFSFLPCIRKSAIEIRDFLRGHSSVGRAPALQAGSQGFESPCLQSLKGVEAVANYDSASQLNCIASPTANDLFRRCDLPSRTTEIQSMKQGYTDR